MSKYSNPTDMANFEAATIRDVSAVATPRLFSLTG